MSHYWTFSNEYLPNQYVSRLTRLDMNICRNCGMIRVGKKQYNYGYMSRSGGPFATKYWIDVEGTTFKYTPRHQNTPRCINYNLLSLESCTKHQKYLMSIENPTLQQQTEMVLMDKHLETFDGFNR